MLNQTFTVLFESLFINELGQAGEGKVWFKTKPIEEWIAENTPPISEQPISFMDFEPNTTVFPVVITGIVVLPNGQVTVVTPNGTFLADTTLIPRPVLKPTVIEDKNGNQFIVHPDGTVTSLGQAGFIPKPMTTEEKLDKIRRGLYLEALKDYKTQIETYYTANNIAIPTRGPRNHNKNIIIDLPECIGTEANEIKDNFLAIKDNVNKKELRENSLKRILGTSKKTTLDFIAQKALDSLNKIPNPSNKTFTDLLSNLNKKMEKDSICSELSGLSGKDKPSVDFKTVSGYDGAFGFDNGYTHRDKSGALGLYKDYSSFTNKNLPVYASNISLVPNQTIQLEIDLNTRDKNSQFKFVRSNSSILINNTNADTISYTYQNLKDNKIITIKVTNITQHNSYTKADNITIYDAKKNIVGKLQIFCDLPVEKELILVYVNHGNGYPVISEADILNELNTKSHNQLHIKWKISTKDSLRNDLLGKNYPILKRIDVTSPYNANQNHYTNKNNVLMNLRAKYQGITNHNNISDGGVRIEEYGLNPSYNTNNNNFIYFFFITNITVQSSASDLYIGGINDLNGNIGALFNGGGLKEISHELGHALNLRHAFKDYKPNTDIIAEPETDDNKKPNAKGQTNNYMDYFNTKEIFFLYQYKKVNRKSNK